MTAVEKLLEIARAEVGYLEKKSNSALYDKTANAGSNNYTKYWAEIKPDYQGQPWCACFVTWCFVQAFGQEMAAKMLKHYPYVYCPTMANLFTLYANPQPGDVVIFKRNGTFTHTGIVETVSGDYFTTIEGNTSGGNTIVANGGGVHQKGYYNSNLPGTKFCRPDWSLVEESEELTLTQYEELKKLIESKNDIINTMGKEIADGKAKNEALKAEIATLKAVVAERTGFFNYIDDNMNASYRPTIQKLVGRGTLKGNENGELMLTNDMMRIFTILDREGVFGA